MLVEYFAFRLGTNSLHVMLQQAVNCSEADLNGAAGMDWHQSATRLITSSYIKHLFSFLHLFFF